MESLPAMPVQLFPLPEKLKLTQEQGFGAKQTHIPVFCGIVFTTPIKRFPPIRRDEEQEQKETESGKCCSWQGRESIHIL